MSPRALTFTLAFLLVAVGLLVLYAWFERDELESLHGRVNELELVRQRRASRTPAATK